MYRESMRQAGINRVIYCTEGRCSANRAIPELPYFIEVLRKKSISEY
jgi:hypothetical protein